MTLDVEIRPYQAGDETSIVEGWNAIFPAQDGLRARDVAYWNWEFRDNPLAQTEVIVAIGDGGVVGQYACVPMRAVDEGQDTTIGLIVDAFVLPAWRRAGGRPGLIIHLARALHDAYCGPRATLSERGHSLLYGYPFPIWRIAQAYLDSEMVRDMDVLFREVTAPNFKAIRRPSDVVVERVDTPEAADELWARCRAETRFGLVRDAAYLDWRYRRHPEKSYEFYVAKDAGDGRVRGLAVFGLGKYVVDAGIFCDWLVPFDDEPAERALLAACEERTLEAGVPAMLAVLPQNDPRFLRWQRQGFLVGPPSHFLVMNTFEHHVRWLRERWFFTLGDSDLV